MGVHERDCEKRQDGEVPGDPHSPREKPRQERHARKGDQIGALGAPRDAPEHPLQELAEKRKPVETRLVRGVEEVLARWQEAHQPPGERRVVVGDIPRLRLVVERRNEHRGEEKEREPAQGPVENRPSASNLFASPAAPCKCA